LAWKLEVILTSALTAGCPAPSDKKLGQLLGQFLKKFRAKIRNCRVSKRNFRAKIWIL
jgi:hypothetical protein